MDKIDRIKELKSLLDSGTITKDEFNKLKSRLLDERSESVGFKKVRSQKKRNNHKSGASLNVELLVSTIFAIFVVSAFMTIDNYDQIKMKLEEIKESRSTIDDDEETDNEEDNNFIYEGGDNVGRLVLKQIYQVKNSNGRTFKIPEGKVWVPLYYEVSVHKGESYNYSTPYIYPDRYKKGKGWFRGTCYRFPVKTDFVSYKLAKSNRRALAEEFALFYDPKSDVDATFTFYFLEY